MAFLRCAVILLALSGLPVEAHRANPIRRVVDMLQGMSDKIKAEGKAQQALFDKFMCWCTTGADDLKASIEAAETKIPQVTSALEEAEAEAAQLAKDLKGAKSDRADAEDAIAKATAIREKEAGAYAKASGDYETNIAALGKAIAAIEAGSSSSFLQTSAAARLEQISVDVAMSSTDRDMLSAFLTQGDDAKYAPQSGEIVGILKQMLETMQKDLADLTAVENKAIKEYEEMVASMKKQIEANTAALEAKLAREGEVGESIVMMKEDLEDTKKALAEDQKFLANLDKACAGKEAEWEAICKERSEELLAIADTIKILNDDDALDLFKKTLPSPSLLQTLASAKTMQAQALKALGGRHRDTRLELISLTLRGGAKNFDKVITMIDEMVVLLGEEQKADDGKKSYCLSAFDKAEDEKKGLEQTASDLDKAIEEAKESIATLTDELAALAAGIKKLDKDVAEATELRKSQHTEFTEIVAADTAAKELIGIAKNRLAKFYNPKLYKPEPKRELSAEDRIAVNMGETMAPTAPPGGIAGTGVTVLAQVSTHTHRRGNEQAAPPPPPETFGAYKKQGESNGGVMALLDMMVADLDKEIQTMTVDEKNAQEEYEEFIADSAEKRALDAQTITDKEGAKAAAETELEKLTMESKDTAAAIMAKDEELKDLHLECDWLLSNFDTRKEARAGEVDSLTKAKAVLSGADYSLVQVANRRTLRR